MSHIDMEQQLQSLNTTVNNKIQQLKIAEQNLAKKEEALDKEKEQMMKGKVGPDDVIQLNVGGEIMATTRSTLCQIHGSLLATMFSGRWEQQLCKDKQGNYFLDFDPAFFKPILSHLRAKKIETPERKAIAPTMPTGKEDDVFRNLVCYLGLQKAFSVCSVLEPPPVVNPMPQPSMINQSIYPMNNALPTMFPPY